MLRICGGCTACCKTYSVLEINKLAGIWCWHCEIGRGCRNYRDRPLGCLVYECEWLRGWGGEEDRPDRSGIVPDRLVSRLLFPPEILQLMEVENGDFEKPQAAVIQLVSRAVECQIPVTFIWSNGRVEALSRLGHLSEKAEMVFRADGFNIVSLTPWERSE